MLAAEPAVGAADLPAADLVTEYTSTPFNEFLIEDAWETGDEGAPPRPDAAAAAAASPGSAAAPASAAAAAASAGSAANGRPRSRTLTAALGVAVLTAAGVAGGLSLHQRTGQQAQAGPSLGRAPTVPPTAPVSVHPTPPAAITPTAPTAPASAPPATAPTAPSAPTVPPFAAPTAPAAVAAPAPAAPAPIAPASALPASSPMPTLTVVPAQWTAPAPIEQWAGWSGRRDQYQSLPAGEHDPQRGWQPQQSGDRWPGRAEWPGARWGVPPDRGGPDGGSQQWQHDGGYQR
ncbi:MAG TPA: hypothetical protein VII22_29370 [Streptosporangiaceae bacterium]